MRQLREGSKRETTHRRFQRGDNSGKVPKEKTAQGRFQRADIKFPEGRQLKEGSKEFGDKLGKVLDSGEKVLSNEKTN